MGLYGIKETKEAITLIGATINMGDAAMADGKIDFADLPHLMALIPVAPAGVEGMGSVGDEMKDMDGDERKELEVHIDLTFGTGTYSEIGQEVIQAAIHLARVYALVSVKKDDA